ncbi:MAG: YeeE/YedE family protein [Sulfuricaulis sp.]|uniref:YeeE/YedE family protein n=1 Tax=Sulfuricaulis sp. TaxID=2003553 RepID=UPI0025F59430|nr:YeeE/YedE family protein [Sulfuricaulis sp.]MCR4347200.1 YeeE/YedE family protein [Sulfuricaulis sp.]
MELSNIHNVALWGFLAAVVFGAIANKTNFCTMGAVSDWVNMDDKNRLRAWFLAIGVAIIGSQLLQAWGFIDLGQSIYLTANFGWLGHALGGFLFGVGMTLSGGCGQRTLVRVGSGNLKSLVVMLLMGITAYMTLRGLLAPVRINVIETTNLDLAARNLSSQGLPTLIQSVTGIADMQVVRWVVAAVVGLGFTLYALASSEFLKSYWNLFAGFSVGLLVVAGWYITGKIGFDEFEPVRLESFTFVAPVGENLNYLMTYTGSTINFGVAAVLGVIAGSFLYAVLSGTFRIETFSTREDMVNHVIGGVLMGFGGVIALGCTIGQGVTGMSTLALGSVITLVTIIFGAALTMKMEYYLMDEQGFFRALRLSLSDLKLLPAAR